VAGKQGFYRNVATGAERVFPGKPPFSLLHVDTTCKFREMLEFRDRYIRELGLKLIVHTNGRGEEKRSSIYLRQGRMVDHDHSGSMEQKK